MGGLSCVTQDCCQSCFEGRGLAPFLRPAFSIPTLMRRYASHENLGAPDSSREKPLDGELKAHPRPTRTLAGTARANVSSRGPASSAQHIFVPIARHGSGLAWSRGRAVVGYGWVYPLDLALRAAPGKCRTPTPDTRPEPWESMGMPFSCWVCRTSQSRPREGEGLLPR